MQRAAAYILVGLAVTFAGAADGLAQTKVYAIVDSQTTMYPGQAFTYSVVVEGGAAPSRVDISPLAPFNPTSAGSGQQMHRDGRRMTVRYSQNYHITAREPGTMVLPGVNVVVDGRQYTTNPVEVTVSKPGTTDRLALEVELSDQECYVGQPVTFTVNWTRKTLVKDLDFDVPVFKSDDFYVEDLAGVRGTYDWTLHGVPVVAIETAHVTKGMETAVVSFSKILIPRRPGRITLDPVTVSVSIPTGRYRTNEIFNPIRVRYERFSVKSDPIELNVLPLPEATPPAAFYGLIGNYTISAQASPTQVSVGDPITLTLRIGGSPYLKPVQWPDLAAALGDDFKIPSEKASPVIDKGEKVFTQTIRANNEAVTEVPAIPLAYLDPETGDYAVALTEPIKLQVAATKVLTERDVEGTSPGTVGRAVEALREGFSANYYGPEVLNDQTFSPLAAIVSPGYAVLWSVPLLGFVASVAYKLFTRTSPQAMARKRRRHACTRAVRQLSKAASADPARRNDLLIAAIKTYLGEKFDRTAGSLTADDCRDLVYAPTGDTELADRVRTKVSEFEAARYASMNAQVDATQIEEAIELVRLVESKVGK